MENKVNPMVLRDEETGDVYTLEYSRESVKFAEGRGFSINEVADFPMTKLPDLFFYAFRKNHKNVARSKTDAMLFEELGGLTQEQIERLIQLYSLPMETMIRKDEEPVKNSKLTVEL